MYSTGLPILYPFAAVFYFVLYWVYKGLLIKYYEKTTRFNEDLPIYSIGWIKLGLIFHGIVGGLMMTNSDLMPAIDALDNEALAELENLTDKDTPNIIVRFFERPYSALYAVFWIGVIIWMLAQNTVLKIIFYVLGCVFEKITGTCSSKEGPTDSKPEAHSNDFYREINVMHLKDLHDKASDEVE